MRSSADVLVVGGRCAGAPLAYIPAELAVMRRRFVNVEAVHLLEGCGHWPFVDAPQRVNEIVVPFLRTKVHGG